LSTIKVTLQTAPPIIAATQAGFIDNTKQAVGDAFDTAAAIINGAIRIVGVMIPVTMLILLPGALVLRFLWRALAFPTTPPPSLVSAEGRRSLRYRGSFSPRAAFRQRSQSIDQRRGYRLEQFR